MESLPVREGDRLAGRTGWSQPLVLLTLAVGGLLSTSVYLLASRLDAQQLEHDVDRAGRSRVAALQVALEEDIETVVALRSLWSASQDVTRQEFAAFTGPLLDRHPALRALEWARVIAPDQEEELVAGVRGEGAMYAQYEVRSLVGGAQPDAGRVGGERCPVVFVEPAAGNEGVLGIDLASEPRRRAALTAAEAADDVRASVPIELTQAPDTRGLLLVLPVYGTGAESGEALPGRRPLGFVVGVLDIEAALGAAIEPLRDEGVRLTTAILARDHEVFSLDLPRSIDGKSGPAPRQGDEGMRPVGDFRLAGLDWRVRAAAGPGFEAGSGGVFAWMLLVAGLFLTMSLGVQAVVRENRARELETKNQALAESNREREKALSALRLSEERFRLLFEHHGSMMLVLDEATGAIVDANSAAEAFYGYSRAQLRSMCVQDLELPSPGYSGRGARDYVVAPHRLASGEERTVEIHSTPIDDHGRRLLFAILHDVTEREAMQRRLLDAQKLESLGVLAGGIAHDFNNLLTSVIGNAELAQRQLPVGSSARGHVAATLKASQHAAALTRRLLAYAGKGSYERRPLDLDAQVREAVELVGPNVPETVRLELELAEGLPQVEGDRLQLQQVAVNLVLNAVESFDDRAGRVRVRTTLAPAPRSGVLPVPAGKAAGGPHILLEVSDNGPGMDELTRARIFEPFFSTKFAGRGLGLASVLGVVRAHSGQLAVRSTPDGGSLFQVWLPACAAPADATADSAGKRCVLVVDEAHAVREVTEGLLVAQGYQVEALASGEAALERVAAGGLRPDAALVDLGLSDPGGPGVVRGLRESVPGLAVVLMSDCGRAEALRRFGPDAPEAFLQKPFTPGALLQRVRSALEQDAGAAPGGAEAEAHAT